MTASVIKQKLLNYIDNSDDKLLQLMYTMAKAYNDDDDFEYEFSQEEIKKFDERKDQRNRNESQMYTIDEAKEVFSGKRQIK